MSEKITDKPEAVDELIGTGSEIAGGAAGAAIGFFTGGPGGAVIGGAAGPFLSKVFRNMASEIGQRILGHREKERVGAAIAYAAVKIRENLAAGKQPRQDDFFKPHPGDRSAAEEIVEGVLLTAQKEWQEKKLRFHGFLLANIAFNPVDRPLANLLVRTSERISYRQMCLLNIFANKHNFPLRQTNYREIGTISPPLGPLLQEVYDLYLQAMVHGSGEAWISVGDINPSKVEVQGTGGMLYNWMELGNLDSKDVAEVAKILS